MKDPFKPLKQSSILRKLTFQVENCLIKVPLKGFKNAIQVEGTLTLPINANIQSKIPLVIFNAGSGPIDRDGNLGNKFRQHIYHLLSAEIASQTSFATFRYDKIGSGKLTKGLFNNAGFWDNVAVLKACHEHFTTESSQNIDPQKIFWLGHSEGGWTCTALASQYLQESPKYPPAGLILLAGFGLNMPEVLQFQRENICAALDEAPGFKGKIFKFLNLKQRFLKQNEALIKRIKESETDTIKIFFTPINAKWFREILAYDAVNDYGKLNGLPIIALSGDMDIQVPSSYISTGENLFKNSNNFTGKIIPSMSHLLKYQENRISMLDLKKEYQKQSSLDMHPNMVNEIISWINLQTGITSRQ